MSFKSKSDMIVILNIVIFRTKLFNLLIRGLGVISFNDLVHNPADSLGYNL